MSDRREFFKSLVGAAPRSRSPTPGSTATRASSCCPSGARRPSARWARRACSSSARGRSARRWRPTWRAPASGGSGSSTTATSSSPTCTASTCTSRPTSASPKAHSAAAKLGFLNPEIVVEPYQARVQRRDGRGPGPGGRLHRLVRGPLRDQRRLLRGRRAARGGRRGRAQRAGDGDPAGGDRLLPLRVPAAPPRARASCAEAGVLGPGGGRDRLAAGARGAQAAGRPAGAHRRLPAGRPALARLPARGRPAARRTARTARPRRL